jgi:hypothetical protein
MAIGLTLSTTNSCNMHMLIIAIFSITMMICYSSTSSSSNRSNNNNNAVNITYHPSEWEDSWKITAHELVKSKESMNTWDKGCHMVRGCNEHI